MLIRCTPQSANPPLLVGSVLAVQLKKRKAINLDYLHIFQLGFTQKAPGTCFARVSLSLKNEIVRAVNKLSSLTQTISGKCEKMVSKSSLRGKLETKALLKGKNNDK